VTPVREIIGRDLIEDLWGAGYTILPRRRNVDPFFVPPEMVPLGFSYQWWHLVHDKKRFVGKWAAVPASRHDGYFMPAGHVGNIEVEGLGLFEKSKALTDAVQAEAHAKARKNVSDWIDRTGAEFSGEVMVAGATATVGDPDQAALILPDTKTIETRVRMPPDMFPYAQEIFDERDALYNALVEAWNGGVALTEQQDAIRRRFEEAEKADPDILRGPTLNALLTPIAIENVRKRITIPYVPPKE
jgi:hypothetical protein